MYSPYSAFNIKNELSKRALVALFSMVLFLAFAGCAKEEEPKPEPLPPLKSFQVVSEKVSYGAPESLPYPEVKAEQSAEGVKERLIQLFEALYLKPSRTGMEKPENFFIKQLKIPEELLLPEDIAKTFSKDGKLTFKNILVAFDVNGKPKLAIADLTFEGSYRKDRTPAGKIAVQGNLSLDLQGETWRIYEAKLNRKYWKAEKERLEGEDTK